MQDKPGRSREDLKKFISEVKHLRIILTERLHFRKPVTCLEWRHRMIDCGGMSHESKRGCFKFRFKFA